MRNPTADVIVAGAGIIGASITWRLAQAGLSVTLADSGTLGGEASWAGAGMLAPGGELVARSDWAQFALDSLALYPSFVEELSRESGVAIDYRQCGAMEVARSAEDWEEIHTRLALQASLGIRSEMREGGVFYPDDAAVDPRDVTRALRVCCQRREVGVLENMPVSEIEAASAGVSVRTAAGILSGRRAVLAAGAWAGAIPVTREGARVATPATFPVRGMLLGYAMPAGSLGPILRHGHTYIMQRGNGYTIAGTSSEQVGFDRQIDPETIERIHRQACELLPELASAARTDAWQGFRPATADFEPAIGRLEDTPVWLAYGHYRNGILLAPATAARIAGEIRSSLEKD